MGNRAVLAGVAGGVAILAGAGTVVGVTEVQQGPEPPRVLPSDGSLAVLDQPAGEGDALPAHLVLYARDSEEPDLSSTRLVTTSGNAALYVFRSALPGRFCAMAASSFPQGHLATVTCGRTADVATGLFTASVQNRYGGMGTPSTVFGIVPDGVDVVVADGQRVKVARNAFAVQRTSDRAWVQKATFVSGDGSEVTVSVPGTP